MYTPGTFEILLLILMAAALEVGLFWAAASLADAPELSLGKTLIVSLVATALWLGAAFALAYSIGPAQLFAEDNRLLAASIAGLGLLVSWFLPAVLYVPLVPVSIPRSMLVSVLQVLLRLFLWVLLTAVFMVILAILQILRGADVRTELLAPIVQALALA